MGTVQGHLSETTFKINHEMEHAGTPLISSKSRQSLSTPLPQSQIDPFPVLSA